MPKFFNIPDTSGTLNINIDCPNCRISFIISSEYKHKNLSHCPNCEFELPTQCVDALKQCLSSYELAKKYSSIYPDAHFGSEEHRFMQSMEFKTGSSKFELSIVARTDKSTCAIYNDMDI